MPKSKSRYGHNSRARMSSVSRCSSFSSTWPCTTAARFVFSFRVLFSFFCVLQFVALYHAGLYIYYFSTKKIRLKVMWPLPRASAKPFLRLPRRCTGNFLFCSSSILTFFLGSFFYFLKQSWDVFRKTNTSLARDSAWDVIKNYVDVFCLFLCSFSLLFFLGRHAAIYVTCTERRSRGKACGT